MEDGECGLGLLYRQVGRMCSLMPLEFCFRKEVIWCLAQQQLKQRAHYIVIYCIYSWNHWKFWRFQPRDSGVFSDLQRVNGNNARYLHIFWFLPVPLDVYKHLLNLACFFNEYILLNLSTWVCLPLSIIYISIYYTYKNDLFKNMFWPYLD